MKRLEHDVEVVIPRSERELPPLGSEGPATSFGRPAPPPVPMAVALGFVRYGLRNARVESARVLKSDLASPTRARDLLLRKDVTVRSASVEL